MDVSSVAEMEPGISDELVLNRSNEANALLLTADKNFGEMVFSRQSNRTGRYIDSAGGLIRREKGRDCCRRLR
jgi:hypothetical protein